MNLDYSSHRSNMESADSEDTAFYTQLTRQILMIMDEDDVTYDRRSRNRDLGFQRRAVSGGSKMSGKYFNWLEDERSLEVPGWIESLWAKNGSGTGVFIPHVVAAANGKPRRRRRQKARKNNDGGRIHLSGGQKIHG
ncbi:hypothetical protein LXL04_011223 [Taraxacum kok-saghyz]